MADEKISLLDALAAPDDADVLVVVDMSATTTKKTTVAELRAVLAGWRSITGSIVAVGGDGAISADAGVLVVDTSATRLLTLPDPATVTGKLPFLVIDGSNNAAAKPISLVRFGAEQIDGVAASKSLAKSGGRWWVWTNGTDWYTAECAPVAAGAVVGPASATDNAIARFDGTTGELVQGSGVLIDDGDNVETAGDILCKALETSGAASIGGDVEGFGNLAVTGSATVGAGLGVTGDVAATGAVDGDTLGAASSLTVNGTTVTGEATASAAGFMSALDKDQVLRRQTRIVLWQDEMVLGLTNRWGVEVAGGSASVTNASAGASYPGGKVAFNTGTTSTGSAGLRAPTNMFYQGGVDEYHALAIVGLGGPLPDGTDNYVVRVLGLYLVPGLTAGFSFLYDHTVSANWQLVRYAGGVVAASADTGIAAATGAAPGYGERRFELVYTPASGGTVTAFIDGAQVAQLTGSFASINAVYPYVARIEKTLGTTARTMICDYSYATVLPATGLRK